ncbi:hypothetical protein L3X38_042084 [Prunus dulcis]|uniref:Non-ATPase subunit 9 n=1 Tax=Prunus dulcis TaxID=3755 RepID=A0AAD4YKZ8_PRUDU|nr:hypothetical protein L3X38_042084 [Prunus dulcis]
MSKKKVGLFCLLKWFLNTKVRILAPRKMEVRSLEWYEHNASCCEEKTSELRPIVEYNKRGKGIGQAHSEMQSYIGVLARSRVPLVDMKWSQIPKDIKEQIWEAVDMAFVVGQGGKNSVLASAAKKWKDFKSTLTRHYILPYTNDREKLSQPPETYKFIEKAQWDAFVASRLSKDFESVHSQHAQIRENELENEL